MAKILCLDLEKCTGCRSCELACSMKHHGEYNPAKSRITVFGFVPTASFIPVFCTQCEEAWCQRICPAGAITKEEVNGVRIVRVSEVKCVGCKICMLACPFGDMSFVSDKQKVQKCDLCDGEPVCVAACTYGALQFKEAEVATLPQKRDTAGRISESYKEVAF
jgi:carbon-monoxide dehydrogenase iron sulfur subunit